MSAININAEAALIVALARRNVNAAGPCPNCGAPADVELIQVGEMDPQYVPGEVRCVNECWRS